MNLKNSLPNNKEKIHKHKSEMTIIFIIPVILVVIDTNDEICHL